MAEFLVVEVRRCRILLGIRNPVAFATNIFQKVELGTDRNGKPASWGVREAATAPVHHFVSRSIAHRLSPSRRVDKLIQHSSFFPR